MAGIIDSQCSVSQRVKQRQRSVLHKGERKEGVRGKEGGEAFVADSSRDGGLTGPERADGPVLYFLATIPRQQGASSGVRSDVLSGRLPAPGQACRLGSSGTSTRSLRQRI
ncbi:hypothetical protein WMY93_015465 [Mugilogobius chulae]|uniref:Uncharacterized protein n=1 Tax=Mugilogobius chulae TaxID=88201 RepID=A0AAW0NWM7_9GOBI